MIVFDEIDAFTRARGSLAGDTSGIRDSVVNQLLAKLDGVEQLDNVLVIGMTNRRELMDAALLRPGRLEVQVEVPVVYLETRVLEVVYVPILHPDSNVVTVEVLVRSSLVSVPLRVQWL